MIRNIFFAVTLFLTACSPSFDAGEYGKLVDATATINPSICADTKELRAGITKFRSQIDWLSLYEGGMPGGSYTSKMLAGVSDEAERFDKLAAGTVSVTYCQIKIEGMRHTMRLILNSEARKPK